jgi:hypothetical protein
MTNVDLVLYALPIPDFTTISPLYFASPPLAAALSPFSGLRQRSYTLKFDEQMEELGDFEDEELPELICFEIVGTFGESDFAYVEGVPGVLVSERALKTLRQFDLGIARVTPYES